MDFPTRSMLRSLGVRPKKHLGQNFLTDRNLAAKTVALADIGPGDTVLEIGPGPGALTSFVTHSPAQCIHLFEIDPVMCRHLALQLQERSALDLHQCDIMRVDLAEYLPANMPGLLIGAIPYHLTSPLITLFLKHTSRLRRAVFIVQLEVARRVCEPPGTAQYGYLSALTRAYACPRMPLTISRSCFYPQPEVDSAVLVLDAAAGMRWDDPAEQWFRRVLQAAFAHKRKQLVNSLYRELHQQIGTKAVVEAGMAEARISASARAEQIEVERIRRLAQVLAPSR